ncbi:MAG: hypothetical protein IPI77_09985 [Saprospiraceae bacterium]|nr:hypothetical protein [Saprospiraceae bacterium]
MKNLLEQVEHFNWIGECNHPDKLEQILSNDRNIHIVLVDVFYNRENKLVRIGSMVQKFNQVKWIILSAYESPALVQQAFLYGVAGYLRKGYHHAGVEPGTQIGMVRQTEHYLPG